MGCRCTLAAAGEGCDRPDAMVGRALRIGRWCGAHRSTRDTTQADFVNQIEPIRVNLDVPTVRMIFEQLETTPTRQTCLAEALAVLFISVLDIHEITRFERT